MIVHVHFHVSISTLNAGRANVHAYACTCNSCLVSCVCHDDGDYSEDSNGGCSCNWQTGVAVRLGIATCGTLIPPNQITGRPP